MGRRTLQRAEALDGHVDLVKVVAALAALRRPPALLAHRAVAGLTPEQALRRRSVPARAWVDRGAAGGGRGCCLASACLLALAAVFSSQAHTPYPHLDDASQLRLALEPRLQQGEEELHKLLAVLLHAMVCGTAGTAGKARCNECRRVRREHALRPPRAPLRSGTRSHSAAACTAPPRQPQQRCRTQVECLGQGLWVCRVTAAELHCQEQLADESQGGRGGAGQGGGTGAQRGPQLLPPTVTRLQRKCNSPGAAGTPHRSCFTIGSSASGCCAAYTARLNAVFANRHCGVGRGQDRSRQGQGGGAGMWAGRRPGCAGIVGKLPAPSSFSSPAQCNTHTPFTPHLKHAVHVAGVAQVLQTHRQAVVLWQGNRQGSSGHAGAGGRQPGTAPARLHRGLGAARLACRR